jgi:hypothetical protein
MEHLPGLSALLNGPFTITVHAVPVVILKGVELDDRFHETGLDEASIHGTGIMFVDSSFEKS